MEYIEISSDFIKLDQFLKLANIVMSGGEAKVIIISEEVLVNGEVCTQRGKKLRSGDIVQVNGRKISIK
ncbi:S4 domain-containing protein YaaA [Peptostreptococcus canis]|uniref:S4 domain-containing protein YaaA n=1 Tax=Peptostreptococcus canis TaxID=1159213 RepID=A0ABR6TMK3_9FIRM|nr:S4 domain-containing protein YaaA [Peptostreptococcus canis]MBC2576652.1 S4 domain-containing protein YaaA [Peptostreptococcus canis]MBP1998598.1 ribosome-associated protein [Peptostreptococcus canis]